LEQGPNILSRVPGEHIAAALQTLAAGEVLYTHGRLSTRCLKTIFGPMEIHRMGYSCDGAPSIYPLDQTLALPARSFSYELQRRLVKAAVQNPFHESVEAIAGPHRRFSPPSSALPPRSCVTFWSIMLAATGLGNVVAPCRK